MIICPFCANLVEDHDMECHHCGQLLRRLKSPVSKAKEQGLSLILEDVLTDTQIIVSENGGILGREGNTHPDFFKEFKDISRLHASIKYDKSVWWIENLTENNLVQVNRTFISKGIVMPLNSNDIVRLNDNVLLKVTFELKKKKVKSKQYYVICDLCQSIIEIDEGDILDLCPFCQDNGTNHSISHLSLKLLDNDFHLPELVLKDIKRNIDVLIPHSGGVIGRCGNICSEQFTDPTIARQHLKITNDNSGWYIENFSQINTTKLNGKYLKLGSIYKIKNQDKIKLDNYVFRVTLLKQLVTLEDDEFYVVCEHCGLLYWLKQDEKISFCEKCDESKKYDVRNVIPTRYGK
jgi:pSer/pThr/pTyr-binding forkhead associated (FHA) protein